VIPTAFVAISSALRTLFLILAVAATAVALLDWAVRTRRLNPFGGLGRFSRRTVAPLIAPVERRVLSYGGNPQNAPWWMLAAVVVVGLLAITLFDFIARQIVMAYVAMTGGPRGILFLILRWGFALLQIALIIRVVSSWFRLGRESRWVAWTYPLTEWLLAPIRRVIPPIGGMVDLSPLIAYFLIMIIERIVLGAL
jgi:YggT family protein